MELHKSVAEALSKQKESDKLKAREAKRDAEAKKTKGERDESSVRWELSKAFGSQRGSMDKDKVLSLLTELDALSGEREGQSARRALLCASIARRERVEEMISELAPKLTEQDLSIVTLVAASAANLSALTKLVELGGVPSINDGRRVFKTTVLGLRNSTGNHAMMSLDDYQVLRFAGKGHDGTMREREACLRMLAQKGWAPANEKEWDALVKQIKEEVSSYSMFDTAIDSPMEALVALGLDVKTEGVAELVILNGSRMKKRDRLNQMERLSKMGVDFGTKGCFLKSPDKSVMQFCLEKGARVRDALPELLRSYPEDYNYRSEQKKCDDFAKSVYSKDPAVLLMKGQYFPSNKFKSIVKGTLVEGILVEGFMSGFESPELREALAAVATMPKARATGDAVLSHGSAEAMRRAIDFGFPPPSAEIVLKNLNLLSEDQLLAALDWGGVKGETATAVLRSLLESSQNGFPGSLLINCPWKASLVSSKLVELGADTKDESGLDLVTKALLAEGRARNVNMKGSFMEVARGLAMAGASMSGKGVAEEVMNDFLVGLAKEMRLKERREKSKEANPGRGAKKAPV